MSIILAHNIYLDQYILNLKYNPNYLLNLNSINFVYLHIEIQNFLANIDQYHVVMYFTSVFPNCYAKETKGSN